MADTSLTQADADALLAMEKHQIDDMVYDILVSGEQVRPDLMA